MIKTLVALIIFSAASSLYATTTLQFSVAGTGRATGFGNAAGVATNGMRWGIVIDTAGDGFDNGQANTNYNMSANNVSGFIPTLVNGVAGTSDDYFFTPASLPVTATQTATGSETVSGVGGIVSAASAPNGNDGIIPGVTANDAFAIIWFDGALANGSAYGLFTHPSFLLPASGTSVSFASVFAGDDPVKTASFTNGAAAPVPEPSRVLLLALALLGCVTRRRR
jgi:hypothetical protein